MRKGAQTFSNFGDVLCQQHSDAKLKGNVRASILYVYSFVDKVLKRGRLCELILRKSWCYEWMQFILCESGPESAVVCMPGQ